MSSFAFVAIVSVHGAPMEDLQNCYRHIFEMRKPNQMAELLHPVLTF